MVLGELRIVQTIETYFDQIFCINLDRRTDRWMHVQEQCRKFGLSKILRFPGYSDLKHDGRVNGHAGCTASHRAILELIAWHKWPRVLVLEDDFSIRHEDFHQRFDSMLPEVPADWDMIYLGGHYADAPKKRISKHVIQFNRMHTTSSYGITESFARKMAPYIYGIGPIDCLYSGFTERNQCYIFQPRLIVQYSSYSDILEQNSAHTQCMEDTRHENMV